MKSGALDYIVKSGTILEELPYIAVSSMREWALLQARRQAAGNSTE